MIALVNYKGNQILIKEGESVKIPYQKDLKPGKTIEFNEVLYFDDGKKKQIGRPYLNPRSVARDIVNSFERFGPRGFKFTGYKDLKNIISDIKSLQNVGNCHSY